MRVRRSIFAAGLAVSAAAAGALRLRKSVDTFKTRSTPLVDPLLERPDDVERSELTTPDGARIHLLQRGAGRPILLVHGITISSEVWAPQMHLLADRYRIVAMDVRGHGRSTVGTEGVGRRIAASDIATVIKSLDLEGLVIVGHSMGGMILMEFAGRYSKLLSERVAGLVFMDTAASGVVPAPLVPLARAGGKVLAGRVEAGYPPLRFLTGGSDLAWLVARLGFGSAPSGRAIAQLRELQAAAAPSAVVGAGVDLIDHDGRWALEATTIPSLVLVGSRDILTPVRQARKIARLLENSRLEVLPGAGHQLMQERPREVSRLIDEFACSLAGPTAAGS
jgi:pimeloyl-ACP methyl ester carboxylesterase